MNQTKTEQIARLLARQVRHHLEATFNSMAAIKVTSFADLPMAAQLRMVAETTIAVCLSACNKHIINPCYSYQTTVLIGCRLTVIWSPD